MVKALSLLRILLFPLSYLYRFLFYLDQRLKKQYTLDDAYVISIGNLSTGGTGKTPMTVMVAKHIHDGFPECVVVILTRGYGGKKSKMGMEVELDSKSMDCGDEPLLLKKNCPCAKVLVGRDRIGQFYKFKTSGKKNIVILDDGFQHRQIKRDLDIVLIDENFPPDRDFPLPAGNLREDDSALARAHFLIFTKGMGELSISNQNYTNSLHKRFPKLQIFRANLSLDAIQGLDGKEYSLEEIRKNKHIFFTGIARPESFYSILEKSGISAEKKFSFPDHYPFSLKDIQKIASSGGGKLICTEKDATKLLFLNDRNLIQRILIVKAITGFSDGSKFFTTMDSEIRNTLRKL